MSSPRGFGRFVMQTLYAKVRAYLLSGTAAAGVAGGILWALSAAGVNVTAPIAGIATSGAALLVGLYASYETRETNAAAARAREAAGATAAPE